MLSMFARIAVLLVLVSGLGRAAPKIALPPETTGPMTISLVHGYSFDPLEGLPELPAGYDAAVPTGDYGYYLLQFAGPIQPEWKATVEELGGEFLWYVPRYAFVCRLPNARVAQIRDLPAVRWLGIDQPAFKVMPGFENIDGPQTLIVVFHYAEDGNALIDQVRDLGAFNVKPEFNPWNKSAKLEIDGSRIADLARLPGVYWIEPYGEITPDNVDASWVDQKGYYGVADTSRPIWRRGVTGRSVLVGLTDQQLWHGHDLFRDPANNTPGPDHRKVVRYVGTLGAASHGTHTGGTLCGDDEPVGGASLNDGLAKHARLIFQYYSQLPTNWDMNVWFARPDSGLMLQGESLSAWNHSMGNLTTNQMGHPVNAKNIISVGGTQNGVNCRTIYSSTSRGPTLDGRRKPQLVSPAENVYSASYSNASGYVSMSGTSMATPNMTGSTALIRDYFRIGFYPTGDTLTGTPLEISAALNKAVAIVGADDNVTGYTVPDNNIGWGRIDLDSSLYFAGDESRLWIMDDTIGLMTGDSAIFDVAVAADARPFRVSLCWTDYPGTMRAAHIQVNHLDLTVTSPSGTEYKGSVYSGGQSVPGGIYDTLNVEECTRVNVPETGVWKIKVNARNVPQGPQPFALAAIGMFGEAELHDVGTSAILAPSGSVDSGDVVTPKAIVRNVGTFPETFDVRFFIGATYQDSASLTLDPGMLDTVDFADWTASAVGTWTVCCTTALSGDENPANDMLQDSVTVLPPTAVSEGPAPLEFELVPASANPGRGILNISYALPNAGPVRLEVFDAAGRSVRTLASANLPAGRYQATWDSRDGLGRSVGSGVYYLRLSADRSVILTKLIRID